MNRLYQSGLKHYPNEFGGLLIGRYSEDKSTVFIQETVLPLKYTSSKYSFKRGTDGLRTMLEKYYERIPNLHYVGEWHTHPDNPAVPSNTDLIALNTIVNHHEVYISSPLLLIMSITKEDYHPVFYVLFQNKIYAYEQE
jgi:integrative and conjugative element protein (TIGR02256 family)